LIRSPRSAVVDGNYAHGAAQREAIGLLALADDPATFDEFHDEPVWADDEPY
jgi:hypothetical protein